MKSTFNRNIPHLLKSEPDWKHKRARILREEPMCRVCARLGYDRKATTVDHIVPRSQGGTGLDSNLQPLCKECHNYKTGKEKHRRLDTKPVVSLDGSPDGAVVVLQPRQFGKSMRARFLGGGNGKA